MSFPRKRESIPKDVRGNQKARKEYVIPAKAGIHTKKCKGEPKSKEGVCHSRESGNPYQKM